MKDGFLRVAGACVPLRVGDPAYNCALYGETAKDAAARGVKVLAFGELSLTGCTCGDLFFDNLLLRASEDALEHYMRETADLDLVSFLGVPVAYGGRIYNCAACVAHGVLLGLTAKRTPAHSHTSDGARHFAPAPSEPLSVFYAGCETVLGAELLYSCETMPECVISALVGSDAFAGDGAFSRLANAGATLMVCLGGESAVIGRAEACRRSLLTKSEEGKLAVLYAGAGEGESGTDLIFSSHHMLLHCGRLLAENPPFGEETYIAGEVDLSLPLILRRETVGYLPEFPDTATEIPFSLETAETALTCPISQTPFVPEDRDVCRARCKHILSLQSRALAGRMERSCSKTAVLGVSGGLDSTLAMLVSAHALDLLGRDRKELLALTMPCFGTTSRTKNNAEVLSECLGASFRTVDIRASVTQHLQDIGHDGSTQDAAYENAQARERTQVLMDYANLMGGLVVGTGDISELALGWATYNGDHMSMYGVNASLPKTLMRSIVTYCAEEAEAMGEGALAEVLWDILDTPISPELLPPTSDGTIAQRTEEHVGPYLLHDFFLYYFLRFHFSPKKIFRLAQYAFRGAYTDEVILHWLRTFLRRFFTQQFKRSCLPDGPKVGSVTLSPRGGWQMPSDATYAMWMRELDALEDAE